MSALGKNGVTHPTGNSLTDTVEAVFTSSFQPSEDVTVSYQSQKEGMLLLVQILHVEVSCLNLNFSSLWPLLTEAQGTRPPRLQSLQFGAYPSPRGSTSAPLIQGSPAPISDENCHGPRV